MTVFPETPVRQNAAAVGGFVDALGGIATTVLAICGLVNINPSVMVSVATIVFGVALLLQAGTSVADLARIARSTGGGAVSVEPGGNVAAVLLIGVAGIVLGILSLLAIDSSVLIPVAVIAYGVAMVLGSSIVPQLHALRLQALPGRLGQSSGAGSELLAAEIAPVSAVCQSLAGLAAAVLGILVLAGLNHPALILVAFLELGATLVITGGALTAMILSGE